MHVHFWLVYAV